MKAKKHYRKHNISVILSVSFLVTLIFSASYAILGINTSYDSSNLNTSLGTRPVFTANNAELVATNFNIIPGTSPVTYLISSSNNATLGLALSSNYDKDVECSYNLKWVWDDDIEYESNSGSSDKEYTIKGYMYDTAIFETQVQNSDESSKTLYSGTIRNPASTSSGSYATYVNIKLQNNFYKTLASQESLVDTTLSGKVIVSDVVCSKVTSAKASTFVGIEVVTPPTKTTYVAGYALELDGIVIKVVYENGASETVTYVSATDTPALKLGEGADQLGTGETEALVCYTISKTTKCNYVTGLTVTNS